LCRRVRRKGKEKDGNALLPRSSDPAVIKKKKSQKAPWNSSFATQRRGGKNKMALAFSVSRRREKNGDRTGSSVRWCKRKGSARLSSSNQKRKEEFESVRPHRKREKKRGSESSYDDRYQEEG